MARHLFVFPLVFLGIYQQVPERLFNIHPGERSLASHCWTWLASQGLLRSLAQDWTREKPCIQYSNAWAFSTCDWVSVPVSHAEGAQSLLLMLPCLQPGLDVLVGVPILLPVSRSCIAACVSPVLFVPIRDIAPYPGGSSSQSCC